MPDSAPPDQPSVTLPVRCLPEGLPPTSSLPIADIIFPPRPVHTQSSVMLVRGTKAPGSSVSDIRVNGIPVTTTDEYENWSVEIPLEVGENLVVAQVAGASGELTVSDQVRVYRSNARLIYPVAVSFDARNDQMLIIDDFDDSLVAAEMSHGVLRVISSADFGAGPRIEKPKSIITDEARNRALIIDSDLAAVMAIDLDSGDRAILTGNGVGEGPELQYPQQLVIDERGGRLILTDMGLPGVLAVDMQTGNRTVLSSPDRGSGPVMDWPQALSLNADGTGVFVAEVSTRSLYEVDLATGDRQLVANDDRGEGLLLAGLRVVMLDKEPGSVLVLVSQDEAVLRVDLATGNREVVSSGIITTAQWVGTGFLYRDPISMTMDTLRGRALVLDERSRVVVAVDLDTGRRTMPWTTCGVQGTVRTRSVAADAVQHRAWAVDSLGLNVVEIDLRSGAQSIISDEAIGAGPLFLGPLHVFSEPSKNRVLVASSTYLGENNWRSGLFAIDLETGERTIVSGEGVGAGIPIHDFPSVGIDHERNRAIILNNSFEEHDRKLVMSVDLETGNRTILSGLDDGTVIGKGPQFQSPSAVLVDTPRNRAIVADSQMQALVAVDLDTGERTIMSNAAHGSGPTFGRPNSIAMDWRPGRVLVSDPSYDALFSVDLITGDRERVVSNEFGNGPELLEPDWAVADAVPGLALVADNRNHGVMIVDLQTSERALLWY